MININKYVLLKQSEILENLIARVNLLFSLDQEYFDDLDECREDIFKSKLIGYCEAPFAKMNDNQIKMYFMTKKVKKLKELHQQHFKKFNEIEYLIRNDLFKNRIDAIKLNLIVSSGKCLSESELIANYYVAMQKLEDLKISLEIIDQTNKNKKRGWF